jgi:hypothetical protein
MTLSAAAEAHRSWTWLIAALVAYGLFLFFTPLLKKLADKIRNPSPPPAIAGVRRTKVQATVGVTDDEPGEPAETDWWGKIVEKGGVRFRQAKQIAATGSHVLPEPDETDLPLDDDEGEDQGGEAIEEYVGRARDLGVAYNQIVRVVVDHYGVSESTAKRRIREVDDSRRADAV